MQKIGSVQPSGALSLKVYRAPTPSTSIWTLLLRALPSWRQPAAVNEWRMRNLPHVLWSMWRIALAQLLGLPHFHGTLYLRVVRVDGTVLDLGLASTRVVTDAGATFLVDNLRASIATIANMKFHGIGTGSTAEAATDTTLVTELTTAYNPDNTRATGSQTNNTAKVYRTVGTNTVDAAAAITEHGIFTQAATGGGTLLDRSIFSVVNLANGDSLQSTYDFTINSGG